MKIDSIKINGFGKMKNKEIDFTDGINIVYGENESGKTTIMNFIKSMLYGVSKNKNGKNMSDFEQYKPWDDTEFSGKIQYTLENGKKYKVFREFKKKNPIIYNNLNEDISKEFCIDKSKGITFFEEQVGIDEASFCNTAMICQKEVELGKTDSNFIVQKISNLVSTGDDNISFKKSMDKLNKMQNENVGTERTKQKPMNIVDGNIKKLSEEKKKLMMYKENATNHFEDRKKIKDELDNVQAKKEFIKEAKEYLDKRKIEELELEFEKNLEKQYFCKVEEIKKKINLERDEKEKKNAKLKVKIYTYILIFFILLAVLVIAFVRNIVIDLFTIIPIGIVIGAMKINKNVKLSKLREINQELVKEYDIVLNAYNQKKKEVKEKEKNQYEENTKIKKLMIDKYRKKFNSSYIEDVLNMNSSKIENEIERIGNTINELNVQDKMIENEKGNIDEKLEDLARIEEILEEQKNIKEELVSLDISFNIAKEALSKAYEEIKHNISPRFQQSLCDIASNITDGKYKNITVNNETGLNIEVENGKYISVDRLSVGTIDEMYLSLRLSTLSEIAKENLPIILDETFAYSDNQRLKNILRYLQDKKYDSQIIIFTCSNREENALNELKIEYNLINLEN